jgi:hypothetical protein
MTTTPDEVYKKCCDLSLNFFLIKLSKVPNDTITNESRRGITNLKYAKCRASVLKCEQILDLQKMQFVNDVLSVLWIYRKRSKVTRYKVGQLVFLDRFDSSEKQLEKVCAPGIHYFNSLIAAFFYIVPWAAFEVHRSKVWMQFDDGGSFKAVHINCSNLACYEVRHSFENKDFIHDFLLRLEQEPVKD